MEDIKVVTTEDYVAMSLEQRRYYYYDLYQKAGELALMLPSFTFKDAKDHPAHFTGEYIKFMAADRMLETLLDVFSELVDEASERIKTSP